MIFVCVRTYTKADILHFSPPVIIGYFCVSICFLFLPQYDIFTRSWTLQTAHPRVGEILPLHQLGLLMMVAYQPARGCCQGTAVSGQEFPAPSTLVHMASIKKQATIQSPEWWRQLKSDNVFSVILRMIGRGPQIEI